MATFVEIEQSAMSLPEDERAQLASTLLSSLPGTLHDEDEGIAEAERRDAELDRDPSKGMTMEQFKAVFEG